VRHGVFRSRHTDRVVGHARAQADHGARHVTGHAGAARAPGRVTSVACSGRHDLRVTRRTDRIACSREGRIPIDVRLMRIAMAGRACRIAFEEAPALPETDRVVREPSRATVHPTPDPALQVVRSSESA
jgi:hypothetical protein